MLYNSIFLFIHFVSSVPNDPVCHQEAIKILANRTSSNIKLELNLTSLYGNNSGGKLCVRTKPSTGQVLCRPVNASTMIFDKLQPSSQYNFSVFSYHNASETLVFSSSFCQISGYTCKLLYIWFPLSFYHFLFLCSSYYVEIDFYFIHSWKYKHTLYSSMSALNSRYLLVNKNISVNIMKIWNVSIFKC